MIASLRFDPNRTGRLRAVVHAVGIPVEAPFSDTRVVETRTCSPRLRLWGTITDLQGRRRVLTRARHEGARCGHRDGEG